ncbi:MAG: hypothetical protein U0V73_05605 [Acidimicrobiia bacterium]
MHDEMEFNRRVSETLMEALAPDGFAASLIATRSSNPGRFDVQLRRNRSGLRSWASLYAGLTTILDVDEQNGLFRLRAHPTHRKAGGFNSDWHSPQTRSELAAAWPAVMQYVTAADAAVARRHVQAEGAVHAALCSGAADEYFVIQREASIAFDNESGKERICTELVDPIYAAVGEASDGEPWWPGVSDGGRRQALGTGLDILAIDRSGRLLAIEAKPANALAGIVWGPAQVRFYAELFARLLSTNTDSIGHLEAMLAQRITLKLTSTDAPETLSEPRVVVPVLAIGPGLISAVARSRMTSVALAVERAEGSATIAPLEVWRLDDHGNIEERWL